MSIRATSALLVRLLRFDQKGAYCLFCPALASMGDHRNFVNRSSRALRALSNRLAIYVLCPTADDAKRLPVWSGERHADDSTWRWDHPKMFALIGKNLHAGAGAYIYSSARVDCHAVSEIAWW